MALDLRKVSRKVKRVLCEQGKTQRCAELFGVSRKVVMRACNMDNEASGVSLRSIGLIAESLGMTTSELLEGCDANPEE